MWEVGLWVSKNVGSGLFKTLCHTCITLLSEISSLFMSYMYALLFYFFSLTFGETLEFSLSITTMS